MENSNQHLEDIKTIKRIMEQSSRFLSLSGLSGVFAGLFAIAGAIAARLIIQGPVINAWGYSKSSSESDDSRRVILLLLLNAVIVLIFALSSALYFSIRKARRSGNKIWTPVSKRLLLSLAIPIVAGGLFILLTLGQLPGSIIVASSLIFYGLGLVNAAKFTFGEIFWLGILEVISGLLCLIIPGYAFVFWVVGFGLLHIGYGLFMYLKYKG
jgi:hypothetical protein